MNVSNERRPLVLETERLILRPRRLDDAEDVQKYFSDPEVRRYLGGYPPSEFEDIRMMIKRTMNDSGFWVITLKGSSRAIGECHIFNVVDNYLASLGYILSREYWGRGIMKEALKAVLPLSFLRLGRLRANIMVGNTKSINLIRRLGFKEEALIRESDFGGRVADAYFYSLTKDEYLERG